MKPQYKEPQMTQIVARNAGPGNPPFGLRVVSGESTLAIPIRLDADEQLLTPEWSAHTVEKFRQAESVVLILDCLLTLRSEERVLVFQFLRDRPEEVLFRFESGGNAFDDVFHGVLNLLPGPEYVEAFAKAKRIFLEAACVLCPDAPELPCRLFLNALRQKDVRGLQIAELRSDLRQVAKEIAVNESPASPALGSRSVLAEWPDAPVGATITVPSAWTLTSSQVMHRDESSIPCRFVIASRGHVQSSGEEFYEIAWYQDDDWKRRTIARAKASHNREILELAAFGFPVTTNNAATIVQFLADFEAMNRQEIPETYITSRLGFQGDDGCLGFLWGRRLIQAKAVKLPSSASPLPSVVFQGADAGDEQLVDSLHASGTFEEWLEGVQVVRSFSPLQLALVGALTPPMLFVLQSPNFVIDFAGETTMGKTTALRLAASCWGNPDESSVNGKPSFLGTWDATRVFKERAPALFNHLPFLLDDTKNAKDKDDVATTVYAIVQGQGRGRGSVKGLALTGRCTTVLMSSGEQPATSFTNDGGTRARVLTSWGSPFGEASPRMGQLARELNHAVRNHYGQAGPKFVEYLLRMRGLWASWRETYRNDVRRFEEKARDNPRAGRMAIHMAALHATAVLAQRALRLPYDLAEAIESLWPKFITEAEDVVTRALIYVIEWSIANPSRFWSPVRKGSPGREPPGGWVGRWDRREPNLTENGNGGLDSGRWEWVGFLRTRLEEILTDGGFVASSTLRSWKERGWLLCDSEKDGTQRSTHKVRLNGDDERLIAIKRNAMEEVRDKK